MRSNDIPMVPVSTRLLVEVWWETRERRRSRRVLRGWVTVLPDGQRRAFSSGNQLAQIVVAAASSQAGSR